MPRIALSAAEHANRRMCADCGGECCKEYAGAYFPADLAPLTAESLAERLLTGAYAIDWWDGDPRSRQDEYGRVCFIRPAHEGAQTLRDPSFGGVCVRLTEAGCNLPFRKRPMMCRALKPRRHRRCRGTFKHPATKRRGAIAWIPHQQLISDAESLANGAAK